jgi:hypothetical protein
MAVRLRAFHLRASRRSQTARSQGGTAAAIIHPRHLRDAKATPLSPLVQLRQKLPAMRT